MKLTKLIGFVAVGMVIPGTILATSNSVLAGEVRITTPNVETVTRSDGSVYVNSGGTIVQTPSRSRSNYWTPWRYWRLPWQKYSHNRPTCRQTSYQATSQVTPSSSSIVQSSISSNSCD